MPRTSLSPNLVIVALLFAFLVPDARGQARREVFIYYANETGCSPAELENYQVIIGWLRSADNRRAEKIAAQLETDLNGFPVRVDAEIATIRDRLPKASPELRGIVFSNHLTRAGKCLILADAGQFEEAAFTPAATDDPILQSNPLSNPLTMRQALAETARRFDPRRHEFILVTNSHGSQKLAVTPRLAIWHERTSREEVLAAVNHVLAEDQIPSWVKNRPGIGRDLHLAELQKAGADFSMTFKVVFDESCEGILSEEQVRKLPGNIQYLYLSGTAFSGPTNLNFAELLAPLSPGESLAGRLSQTLSGRFAGYIVDGERKPNALDSIQRPLPWPALLCFVPLAMWLSWFVWKKKFGKHHEPPA